jgi:hypothetical protein
MKYRYYPTQEDIQKATSFAEKFISDHIRGTRSVEVMKRDMVIGKLGEIAYRRYWGDSVSEVEWSGIPQGSQPDFIRNSESDQPIRVEIKTIEKETKWCTFGNWNFEELVLFRLEDGVIHWINTYTYPILKEKAKLSNFGKKWYFDPELSFRREIKPSPPNYNYYP